PRAQPHPRARHTGHAGAHRERPAIRLPRRRAQPGAAPPQGGAGATQRGRGTGCPGDRAGLRVGRRNKSMTTGKFSANSRYIQTVVAVRTGPDGVPRRYLRRRFLPKPAAPALDTYQISEGDRIDRIAASTLGDAGLWWRVADANRALDPDVL